MSTATNVSLPVPSTLGLLFVTLKLTGFINWSWWWVLAPFWLPVALGIAVLGVYLLVLALIFLVSLCLK